MSAKFEATKPSEMRFTLTVTLTLGEWEKVKERLDGMECTTQTVCWPVVEAIRDMVRQVEHTYYPSAKVTQP